MSDTSAEDKKKALRNAFGSFMTGVTIVTTLADDDQPIGFTANSFASVSLDPPLLSVCVAKTSRSYETIIKADGFAINILAADQRDVSDRFARRDPERFTATNWEAGPNGAPVLSGVAAWFDCSREQTIDAGDHAILIGRIEAFKDNAGQGLGYARGAYFTAALENKAIQAAAAAPEYTAGVVAVRDSHVLLDRSSDGKYRLPSCPVSATAGAGGCAAAPAAAVSSMLGVDVRLGFIFSVYRDGVGDALNIVYRCELGEGKPARGHFFPIDDLPLDALIDVSTRDLLSRFAAEAAVNSFNTYLGDEKGGVVLPSSAMVTAWA
ncbi:flavin reductase family protein [Rhizobium sp. 2MFCol3.1]|uniref:flavin reductase family protein n=1 Tax=Rhizobium sp. 2MFCol3.1 TaxID=1246459 RepID=UPI0003671B4F|nr:flavin reductase family protein [Rhizobium sp. 2MFCol3.1]